MYQPAQHTDDRPRKAMILLVVIALLTLFAIIALTFVLYSESSATSSRIFREAVHPSVGGPDEPVDLMLKFSLGQLLFGVDDQSGVYSALRGHDLGRDFYGFNYNWTPPTPPATTPTITPLNNVNAFNGTGRLHWPNPNLTALNAGNPADDYYYPNYTYYQADNFLRDPERLGTRSALTNPPAPYTGGQNSSYTAADVNHMYLAAVQANGNVLLPSFHRPYLFGPIYDPMNPTNPANNVHWTDAIGKYILMRPRPIDMGPGFPYPADPGGDVKQLVGNPNPNSDSIWMDLDYPVRAMPDGTKYKPLFAFLIEDLDGRVNANVHGNVRGIGPTNRSNQGWGKWEINLNQVLNQNGNEYANLLIGNGTMTGRYGADKQPTASGSVSMPGTLAHTYAQADLDAANESSTPPGQVTAPFTLPAGTNAFPTFPQGYSNGIPIERTNHPMLYNVIAPGGDDRVFNVSNMFTLLTGAFTQTSMQNSDMYTLCPNNFNQARICNLVTTDSWDLDRPALTPWVYDVANTMGPTNTYALSSPTSDQPPIGSPIAFPALALRGGGANVPIFSEFAIPNQPQTTPGVDWRGNNPLVGALNPKALFQRLDMNRFLPPYPHMGRGTNPNPLSGANPSGYSSSPLIGPPGPNPPPMYPPGTPFTIDQGTNGPVWQQFQAAHNARQQFADDIYRLLLQIADVPPPAAPAAPTPTELAPRRWLAQLAVNMVDFVDEDDISTPFQFYTQYDGLPAAANPFTAAPPASPPNPNGPELLLYWVFGTEMPRVVLNEVLIEYGTPPTPPPVPPPPPTAPLTVRVYAELYNPLPTSAGPATQPLDTTPVPLTITAGGAPYSIYQIVVADTAVPPALAAGGDGLIQPPSPYNNDVLGTPDQIRGGMYPGGPPAGSPASFPTTPPGTVPTVGGGTAPLTIAPGQYFLAVPFRTGQPGQPNPAAAGSFMLPGTAYDYRNSIVAPRVPGTTPIAELPNMQYQVNYTFAGGAWTTPWGGPDDRTNGQSVLLRRLANPYLPPSAVSAFVPGTTVPNPYMTQDYLTGLPFGGNDGSNPATVYRASGKLQPYAAYFNQVQLQNQPAAGSPPNSNNTKHTFGSANSPIASPFNWLFHPDRPLISPMELLQVSGYRPHMLTQKFVTGTAASPQPYTHRVHWFDENLAAGTNQSNRLYRLFEYLTTRDIAAGMNLGGRVAGKININTVYDPETFNALADPSSPPTSNHFSPADVTAIFNNLLQSRMPGDMANGIPPGQPSLQDQPFRGFTTGYSTGAAIGDTQYPNGSGIQNTLLRPVPGGGPTSPRLFQAPSLAGQAPYLQDELLTKIARNVTTRSNTFAIWITIGFFYVSDDTVRPVKLGAEVGAQYRHNIFVVVDRTNMHVALPQPTLAVGSGPGAQPITLLNPVPLPQGGPQAVPFQVGTIGPPPTPVNSGTTTNGMPWNLATGTLLAIDSGPLQEIVTLQPNAPPGQLLATFNQPHGAGALVTIPGNPGPQQTFDYKDPNFAGIVRYYQIID